MSYNLRVLFLLLAAAALTGPARATAQERSHAHGHGTDPAHAAHGERPPLLQGLGNWSWRVSTRVPAAQQYFDQGLRLTYGFNHDEARLSFEEALRLDPSCAMCAWGIAYALSPNINMPMPAEAEAEALVAARRAAALAGRASGRERDLIGAMVRRFGEPAGEQRAARDSAYAAAMREVARRHAQDVDVQVLYADAMLNLRPWNQWTRDGRPQPGTLEVVATLERAMALAPDHAGACHLYVHTIEASPTPERALDCARRLPRLMPGAGHLVHMPAHVYLRVGMYEEAARANIEAVEADRLYFATREVAPGIYPLFYAPHNLHFLWAAYTLSGQKQKALEAARSLVDRVAVEDARGEAALQGFLPSLFLTHVRFGDWHAMLREPDPAGGLLYVQGMWHYARGVAHAALGDVSAAVAELERLRITEAAAPADMIVILNSAPDLLRVARLVLEGRIAAARGDIDGALLALREATAAEDALTYDEPPPWYEPVRQVLGTVLLRAGRHAEAEAVFRDDLLWVRENGWSLYGLERSLRALGRAAAADSAALRLEQAWRNADVSAELPLQRVQFRSARLPTSVRMRYAEAGSGTPVVLVHGYTDSWFSWSRVLPLLPGNVRVIAPDLRGHGASLYDGSDYSIRAMAADVAELLKQLGIERATVVGHSMGSLVAQALAVEHPSLVAGLVLVGAMRGGDEVLAELKGDVAGLPDPVPEEFVRGFQEATLHGDVPPEFMTGVVAESSRLRRHVWTAAADAMLDTGYRSRLRDVRVPTLLVWGADDGFFPLETQQALLRSLSGARLVTYPETGHGVHWERPDRFAADLAAFLAGSR